MCGPSNDPGLWSRRAAPGDAGRQGWKHPAARATDRKKQRQLCLVCHFPPLDPRWSLSLWCSVVSPQVWISLVKSCPDDQKSFWELLGNPSSSTTGSPLLMWHKEHSSVKEKPSSSSPCIFSGTLWRTAVGRGISPNQISVCLDDKICKVHSEFSNHRATISNSQAHFSALSSR